MNAGSVVNLTFGLAIAVTILKWANVIDWIWFGSFGWTVYFILAIVCIGVGKSNLDKVTFGTNILRS